MPGGVGGAVQAARFAGGLIVGVVVAAPGGACGRLPVRARSCWVRGCGRAGGSLLA